MQSPIKYYGGKTYMTDIIKDNFPSEFKTYIEGFGGGASVLFSKEPSKIEIYNDLEENVYSLFKVLSDESLMKEMKSKLDLTPYSRQIREEFKLDLKKKDLSIVERAYKFFYVNRTSFNGVGGFSVTMLPRRNMMKNVSSYLSLIDGMETFHQRLSSAVIEHLDIFDLLSKYDYTDTFFYLDPPYVQSTRKSSQRYGVEMSDDDHKRFVEVCNSLRGKVLISGYDNPIYEGLKGFEKITFKSPNAGSEATECLWRNYPVKNINKSKEEQGLREFKWT